MNAREAFGSMVSSGVFGDIMIALQATYVFEAVGENSDRVNKSTYLPVFATLQSYAADQFILAVNRLLERQTKRYPLQGVEGVLQFLLEHAASFSPREPVFLEQALKRLGVWDDSLAGTGEDVTKKVVNLLLNALPHYENHDAPRALKTMRDKHIDHPLLKVNLFCPGINRRYRHRYRHCRSACGRSSAQQVSSALPAECWSRVASGGARARTSRSNGKSRR